MSELRIDKFLWAIRAYKTRSEASEACKSNKVKINGNLVKSSRTVEISDLIEFRKGIVNYSYRIKDLLTHRVGAKLVEDYIEDLTPIEEINKLKAPVETFFLKRDRGSGRPTKKERRELDELLDSL